MISQPQTQTLFIIHCPFSIFHYPGKFQFTVHMPLL